MCMQQKKYNSFITIMIKMVGNSCNMNCTYCYEHISTKKNVNITSVTEVIEYLKQYKNYKHVFFVFHGGEPLLADINLIKKCLNYITKNFYNEYNIQFQTNGTLLNNEWIQLFKKYEPQLSLSISLDPIGIKDLRKSYNMDYRKIVERNISLYANELSNVGIISVVHRYNIHFFIPFIEWLINHKIKNLTINKYRTNNFNNNAYITEMEYTKFLKKLCIIWIKKELYKTINIQPLNSLLSNSKNKLCIYLPDEKKCTYFKTFFNGKNISDYCDHIIDKNEPILSNKCKTCEIYSLCGGGCLIEKKDNTFCEARKELFKFISEVKK